MSREPISAPPDPNRYVSSDRQMSWPGIAAALYRWLYSVYVGVKDPVYFSDVVTIKPIARPTTPAEGMIYPDKDDSHIYCYLGGTWKQLD